MKYNLHVSEGNTKLGKIPSVSLDPHLTCNPGGPCYRRCYARRLAAFRPLVRKYWIENTSMLLHAPDDFERDLVSWILGKSPKYFRWHVGGEVIDQKHANLIKRVVRKCKNTRFLLYTRRDDLKWGKPLGNMKIFFSKWQNHDARPDRKHPWAIVGDDPEPQDTVHVCPGACPTCMFCYNDRSNKSVQFKFH